MSARGAWGWHYPEAPQGVSGALVPIYRPAATGGGSTGSAVRATSYRLITWP